MATQQAPTAAGAAGQDPGDLKQRGDELLLRYQSESFQKAVSNGRYTREHKALLNDIFEFIQDADLGVEQLSMLPAEADLVADWGLWMWVRPPVRNSRAQQEPEEAAAALPPPTAAAAAAMAAATELIPIAATSMAAVGEADSRSLGVQRDRMRRSSDGIRRSFSGYTAATPISLGRGRFMLSLPMRLRDAVLESSDLADCMLRQWVCAVHQEQYAAALLESEGAPGVQSLHQVLSIGSDDDAAAFDATLWSLTDLPDPLGSGSHPELPIISGLATFQRAAAPLHLSEDGAADDRIPGGGTPAAAAAAAAAGAISSSLFHFTHDRVETITFKKKSNRNNGGATAASSSQGAAPARAAMQLLVDTSVGWCVLEPGRELKPRQAKRSRTGSPAALEGAGVAADLGQTPPDAAAVAATASAPMVSPGLGLGGLCGTAAAAAAAGKSTVTTMQSGAPSGALRATSASEHLSDAVTSLSQRIQRLQLPELHPVDVVAVFHPKAGVLKAPAILSDAAQLALLKQALLAQDIRDKFDRNVLHLAATRRAADQLGSPLQQQLLELLLDDDAELRQLSLDKLQLQGNNNGSTPLIVAASAAGDQPEVFSKLLAVANADVLEARTRHGWTVLHTLASAADSCVAAGELAGEGASEQQPSGYLGCIAATISRLVAVAREAAASELQLSEAQQQELVSEWVTRVVGRAEPHSRHYKGQRIMAWARQRVQQMLREALSG